MSEFIFSDSLFFTLTDHAARESGGARRKPGTGFSDAISGGLGRLAAQTSESEKSCIDKIFHSFFLNISLFQYSSTGQRFFGVRSAINASMPSAMPPAIFF